MATKKNSPANNELASGSPAKKKKSAPRKRAAKAAAAAAAPAVPSAAVGGDRLTEVAKTIGSTVGDIVAKTKRALHRKG